MKNIIATLFSLLLSYNLYAQLIPVCKNNKWGYCDTALNLIISPNYDIALPFNSGFAKVGNFSFETFSNKGADKLEFPEYITRVIKSGLIDSLGNSVFGCEFDDIRWDSHYIVLTKRQSKWISNVGNRDEQLKSNQISDSVIILDRNKNVLHSEKNAYVVLMGENMFAIVKQEYVGKMVIYLFNKNNLIRRIIGSEISEYKNEISQIRNGVYINYIDRKGKVIFNSKKFNATGDNIHNEYLMANDSMIFLFNNNFKCIMQWNKKIESLDDLKTLVSVISKHRNTVARFSKFFEFSFEDLNINFNALNNLFEARRKYFSEEDGRYLFEYGTIVISDKVDFLRTDFIGDFPNYCRTIYADFLDDYLNKYKNELTFICHFGDESEGFVSHYRSTKGKSYILKE